MRQTPLAALVLFAVASSALGGCFWHHDEPARYDRHDEHYDHHDDHHDDHRP